MSFLFLLWMLYSNNYFNSCRKGVKLSYTKFKVQNINGDVIHRYKVKAKVADKKEAVKTGASAGQFILPLVGLGGLGGLVTFAARRKAKRKG